MSDPARPQSLRRILGLGFGLAMAFGGTVGVGILRLPGTLAAALGDGRLVLLFWVLGGAYALLGATAVAELAAMFPAAGGFYVYARRAFGDGGGFVIGWTDWINTVSSLAYGAITAATFLGALWAPAAAHGTATALAILVLFTGLHWVGLRLGSTITSSICVTVGLMLLLLVVGCFLVPPLPASDALPPPASAALLPLHSFAMLAAVVTALRAVLVTFDGWYSPIYVAEESTDPARTLPKAIVGGTILVAVLYFVINAAFLRVIPLSTLAASELPAADAARAILPHGGAQAVTLISLLTVLSLINAVLIIAPRILLAIGRDGFFVDAAARVSAGGTPRVALALSSLIAAFLILSGTFEQIVALAAVLFVFNYISAYAGLIVLRVRSPGLARPYRAFGFPYTTAIVLVGSLLFLGAAVSEDRRSGVIAGILLLACIPGYALVRRRNRARGA